MSRGKVIRVLDVPVVAEVEGRVMVNELALDQLKALATHPGSRKYPSTVVCEWNSRTLEQVAESVLNEALKPTGNPLVDQLRQLVAERKAQKKAAKEQPTAGKQPTADEQPAPGEQPEKGMTLSADMEQRIRQARSSLVKAVTEGAPMDDAGMQAFEDCHWLVL